MRSMQSVPVMKGEGGLKEKTVLKVGAGGVELPERDRKGRKYMVRIAMSDVTKFVAIT